jgi:hypothetical protein
MSPHTQTLTQAFLSETNGTVEEELDYEENEPSSSLNRKEVTPLKAATLNASNRSRQERHAEEKTIERKKALVVVDKPIAGSPQKNAKTSPDKKANEAVTSERRIISLKPKTRGESHPKPSALINDPTKTSKMIRVGE